MLPADHGLWFPFCLAVEGHRRPNHRCQIRGPNRPPGQRWEKQKREISLGLNLDFERSLCAGLRGYTASTSICRSFSYPKHIAFHSFAFSLFRVFTLSRFHSTLAQEKLRPLSQDTFLLVFVFVFYTNTFC